MRARGGASSRGWGGKGGGDDAMFGNRYLRAHAQGTTRVVGGAGGEERGRGASSRCPTAPTAPTVVAPRLRIEGSLQLASLQSPRSVLLTSASVLSPPKETPIFLAPDPLPANGRQVF